MNTGLSLRRACAPFVIAGFLHLMTASHALAQCAMCKEAVDGDKAAGGSVADGISWSILFMLSLPPLIMGGFSFAVWRAYRKAGPNPSA